MRQQSASVCRCLRLHCSPAIFYRPAISTRSPILLAEKESKYEISVHPNILIPLWPFHVQERGMKKLRIFKFDAHALTFAPCRSLLLCIPSLRWTMDHGHGGWRTMVGGRHIALGLLDRGTVVLAWPGWPFIISTERAHWHVAGVHSLSDLLLE